MMLQDGKKAKKASRMNVGVESVDSLAPPHQKQKIDERTSTTCRLMLLCQNLSAAGCVLFPCQSPARTGGLHNEYSYFQPLLSCGRLMFIIPEEDMGKNYYCSNQTRLTCGRPRRR